MGRISARSYYRRHRVLKWRRIHTSFVISLLLNLLLVGLAGLMAKETAETPTYEVSLVNKTELKPPPPKPHPVKQRYTLALPAGPRHGNGARPGELPPPLNGRPRSAQTVPQMVVVPQRIIRSGPSVITAHDPNPEKAPENASPSEEEGNRQGGGGVDGNGGGGQGGADTGGGGLPGGRLGKLVNRVECFGCHQEYYHSDWDQSPRPNGLEAVFATYRNKGGTEHDMTLRCTIDKGGYVTDAVSPRVVAIPTSTTPPSRSSKPRTGNPPGSVMTKWRQISTFI